MLSRLRKLKEEYDSQRYALERAENAYRKELRSTFHKCVVDIFVTHPDLKDFYWTQHGSWVHTKHLQDSEEVKSRTDVLELFDIFSTDELKMLFGEYVYVHATREGLAVSPWEP